MATTFLHVMVAACLSLSILQCEGGGGIDPEKMLDKIDPKLKEHIQACEAELNVSMKVCHDNYKKKPETIPEDCRCFAACVGKKSEVIDKEGLIIPERLKKKMEEIKDEGIKKCAKKLYEDCKSAPKGEGGCSDMNNLVICFAMHAQAHKEECTFT